MTRSIRQRLRGTITAIVTPFTTQGQLDESALRTLIRKQMIAGVNGVVPCGTTGESPTLSHDEHDRVVEITVEEVRASGRDALVIAGTGSNATAEALRLTRAAAAAGADACLQVNPYYNRPTQEGLYRHFATIADDGGLPICLYNIPGRSAVKLETETIARLAKHEQIVAMKEATGSMDEASALVCATDLVLLSGDDSMTLPLMAIGGQGVISVLSNLVPEDVLAMTDAALAGDWAAAREQHKRLFRLAKGLLSLETNPIPIKTAMAMQGWLSDSLRLPLCPMGEANKAKLRALLAEALPATV